jgi:hypothetical protein
VICDLTIIAQTHTGSDERECAKHGPRPDMRILFDHNVGTNAGGGIDRCLWID